jgi:hypothetical protein
MNFQLMAKLQKAINFEGLKNLENGIVEFKL